MSLTVYLTSTADTLVTTANTLTPSAPASETSKTSKTGKLTAWGVLWSQGNTGTWAAGASEPAFGDVHGFLWDVTTLEGCQILAGAWSTSVKVSTSAGTVTGVVHIRVGNRSSGGVFTQIVDMATASTGFTSVAAVVTASGSTVSPTTFNVGDKLYVDIVLDITANTSSSTNATTALFENGGANESITGPTFVSTNASAVGDQGGSMWPSPYQAYC